MGGGFQIVELILLAMIAGFVALRLRNVLGKKTGHEHTRQPNGQAGNVHNLHGKISSEDHAKNKFLIALEAFGTLPTTVKENLKSLNELEPGFDLNGFLEGSKSAYPMILENFWAGDMGLIKSFLNKTICKQFQTVIDDREAEGLVVENKVLEIRDTDIKDVQINGKTVEITVEFKTDIISVTRDKDGKLVEGDLTDAVDVVDVWTFARKVGNQDPNWTLVQTRAG